MKKNFIAFLFLLSACSPVAASITETPESVSLPSLTPTKTRTVTPMPSPRPSPTPTPEPSWTHIPSLTRAPTATIPWPDLPPLNPDGPYIEWMHPILGSLLINADGSGLGRLDLPAHEEQDYAGKWHLYHNTIRTISPDGDWALMYQGGDYDWPPNRDLTVSLVHLPDGEILDEILILPDSARQSRYGSYECGMLYVASHFSQAAWSPDGRYLAYAAYADSGTSDLFVFDVHERKSRRLTNDPAEIEQIVWSPTGNRIYFTNGNDFDIDWAISGSSTLNFTQPGNATNQGIQTLEISNDRLLVEGFNRDAGLIYAAHQNTGCLSGVDNIRKITYFHTSTDTQTIIGSGNIFGPSLLVDTVNRAVIYFLNDPEAPEDDSFRTQIVSFDGKILTTINGWSVQCGYTVLLSGPKYAYLCENLGNPGGLIGITFGGKTEKLEKDGSVFVSPDRKWFLVFGENTSLFSRDMQLVQSWEGEEAFDRLPYFFWDPSGKGIYYANDMKRIQFFSFSTKATSVIFTCPFADGCYFPGQWVP